jgi:stage II sporulation protein AA (anti-sigma F factor antagonist)
MNLEFNVLGSVLIVTMTGELDHHSAEEVRNKIDDRLDREGIIKLVLNFSGVKFMDSSGIGVVIGRYKRLSLKHGIVYVSNVNESIKRVFEISGMFKIIKLYDTVEQAVSNI